MMKFEMILKNTDLKTFETLESFVSGLNNGVAYENGTTPGYVRILRLEIKSIAPQYKPDIVMSDTGGHFIQYLENHGKELPENNFIPLNHYIIGYIFQTMMKEEKAIEIEQALANRVLQKFEHINMADGYVKGLAQRGNHIIEGKASDYKNNEYFLDTDEFDDEVLRKEKIKDFIERTNLTTKTSYIDMMEKQLIDMAEFAKRNNIKVEDKRVMNRIGYGIFNNSLKGEYSQDVAIKVLDLIGMNGDYDKFINAKSRKASVASFFKWIRDNGYDKDFVTDYYKGMNDEKVNIVMESPLYINQFIDENDENNTLKIFENEHKNVLVSSPTGSGKTTAFTCAAKMWMDVDRKKRIFVFLSPTTPLTEQVAKEHGMYRPLFGSSSVVDVMRYNYEESKKDMEEETGYWQVAATYDKAKAIMKYIEYNHPNAEVLVVFDEAHKEVSDYDFRREAISSVNIAKEHPQTVKFVGLSGTPQEVDKSHYDQLVTFEIVEKGTPFTNLIVPEYNKMAEFAPSTTKLIVNSVQEGRKVLVFVQNRDLLEDIKKRLDKDNINSSVVRSGLTDVEGIEVYDHLVTEQDFADDVQVILSTNFIADGVSIKNSSDKYDVIIAPDRKTAPIFNLSQIKQMSNRLRNKYENLIIPLFVSDTLPKERQTTKLFDFETRFKEINYTNELAAKELRDMFGDRIEEYHPGELEQLSGLPWINLYADSPFSEKELGESLEDRMKKYRYYMNKIDIEPTQSSMDEIAEVEEMSKMLFTVDRRANRKLVSREQEDYYSIRPHAFVAGLEGILEASAERVSMYDYVEGVSAEKQALIDSHFPELEELREMEEVKKRERFTEVVTEEVYKELQAEYLNNNRKMLTNTKLVRELKELVSSVDMKVIEDNIYGSYDHVLNVVNNTSSKKEQSKFKNRFRAKKNLDGWKKASKKNDTHKVVDMLKDAIANKENYIQDAKGRYILPTNTINKVIIPQIVADVSSPKDPLKVSTVKRLFNNYFIFEDVQVKVDGKSIRGKYNIVEVSEESIAKEYGADVIDIRQAYKNFIFDQEQKHAA